MVSVIATGPAQEPQNPFAALGQPLGQIAGQQFNQYRRDQMVDDRARRLAGVMDSVIGSQGAPAPGGTAPGGAPGGGQGQPAPVSPGQAGQLASQIRGMGDFGARATVDALGSVDVAQEEQATERIAQTNSPIGRMFQQFGPDKRKQFTRTMLEGGVKPTEVLSMVMPQQRELEAVETDSGIYAFDPGTGRAQRAAQFPEDTGLGKMSRDQFVAHLAKKVQRGEMGREEFARKRDLILQDPPGAGGGYPGGLKSDLLDEQGNVKTEATGELRRTIGKATGTGINPDTGEFTGSPAQRQHAMQIMQRAEQLIRQGQAQGLGEASVKAMEEVPKPESEQAEIQVPEAKREELLSAVSDIDRVEALADDMLSKVRQGTGMASNLQALTNATVGQVVNSISPGTTLFEDTAEARQELKQFNQEVKRTFKQGNRFAQWENELINDLLPQPQDWFANPDTAAADFKRLVDFLQRRKQAFDQQLQGKSAQEDPGGRQQLSDFTPDQRQTIQNAQQAIQQGKDRRAIIQKMKANGWTDEQIQQAGL